MRLYYTSIYCNEDGAGEVLRHKTAEAAREHLDNIWEHLTENEKKKYKSGGYDTFKAFEIEATEEQLEDPFVDGMNKVYKQMITSLEELGVKPIEAVGAEFNPDYHNAVMHVEDEEVGENIIVQEFQKGYTYKDFVVRHSMVKVAN